jgi:hypothetical protein
MALMKKELFICDRCGLRKRLPSAVRHWCDNCDYGGHFEMRPARDKKLVITSRGKMPEAAQPPPQNQPEPPNRRLIF